MLREKMSVQLFTETCVEWEELQEIEVIQFTALRKIALFLKERSLEEAVGNNVSYKTPNIMAQGFLADIYNASVSQSSYFLF